MFNESNLGGCMNTKSIVLTGIVLALSIGVVLASGGMKPKGCCGMAAHHKDAADAKAGVNVGNTICPVSGEKVGEMGAAVPYVYNGKTYNLCCAMCAKDFKNDPAKYSKIAEEQAQVK
jgi:YHS domain-containing protein